MGISSLPSPSDGIIPFLAINTASSVAAVKGAAHSVLSALRLRRPEPNPSSRVRVEPVRLDRAAGDCRVCLGQFEPDALASRLPCGHVFHSGCVETGLDYRHVTCPLCRARLVAAGDEAEDLWEWS